MESNKKAKNGDFITFIQRSLKRAGVLIPEEDIARRTIGSPDDLLRPFLVEAVKKFQNRSDKSSLLSKDKKPLKWLPNTVTIGMIDQYFAEGCPEIEKYQASLRPKKLLDFDIDINIADSQKIKELRLELLRRYADKCGLRTAGLEERRVKQCFSVSLPCWEQPIFDLEDEINDQLYSGVLFTLSKNGQYINWINDETSVGELMDTFIECLIELKKKISK